MGYEEFYVLGGYDRDFGFHDTVEKFSGNPSSSNGSSWTMQYDMNLTTPKSHFCTVFVQVRQISFVANQRSLCAHSVGGFHEYEHEFVKRNYKKFWLEIWHLWEQGLFDLLWPPPSRYGELCRLIIARFSWNPVNAPRNLWFSQSLSSKKHSTTLNQSLEKNFRFCP
jgi:hypothetical protein